VQGAYGLYHDLDIRLRYELIWGAEETITEAISVLGAGAKYSVLKNYIAFSMMGGTTVNKSSKNNWQLHSSFLFTLPVVQNKLEFTLSPKYLMAFCKNCEDLIAVNLGLAVGNFAKFTVRPEFGMLFNPGNSGYYGQGSIGVAMVFGKKPD
jgi:hypothetical protein